MKKLDEENKQRKKDIAHLNSKLKEISSKHGKVKADTHQAKDQEGQHPSITQAPPPMIFGTQPPLFPLPQPSLPFYYYPPAPM